MAAGGFQVVISASDKVTAVVDKINARLNRFRQQSPDRRDWGMRAQASMENLRRSLAKTMDVSGVTRMTRTFTGFVEKIKDGATGIQKMGIHLKSLAGSLGLLSAFSLAGIGKTLAGTGEFSKNINNMAARTGLKTDDIQAWRNAGEIKLGRGGAEVMDSSLEAFGQLSQDAANGRLSGQQMQLMKVTGITKEQASAGFTGEQATSAMMKVADQVQQVIAAQKGDPRAGGHYLESIGLSTKLLPMMQGGSAGMQKYLDQGRQNILTPQQLKDAEQFNESITKLTQSLTNLGETIAAGVSPKLTELVDRFNAWVKSTDGQEFIQQIIDWLNKLIDSISKVDWKAFGADIVAIKDDVVAVAKAIDWAVQSTTGWKTAIELMVGAWAAFKIVAIIKGIVGIVAVIAELALGLGKVTTAIAAMGGAWLALPAGLAFLAKLGSDYETPATQKKREENRKEMGGNQSPANMPLNDGYNADGTPVASPVPYPPAPQRQRSPVPPLPAQPESPIPHQFPEVRAPLQPAVTGSLDNLSQQTGLKPNEAVALRESVAGIEHARYDQMGGDHGHFAGRYQMGQAAISDTAKHLGVPVPSQQQFLADPAMQDRFYEQFTLDNHKYLTAHSQKYALSSPEKKAEALAYAHNQGAGGASNWLSTGQVGRDAFNTPGTRYSQAVQQSISKLGDAAQQVQVAQAPPAQPSPAAQAQAQPPQVPSPPALPPLISKAEAAQPPVQNAPVFPAPVASPVINQVKVPPPIQSPSPPPPELPKVPEVTIPPINVPAPQSPVDYSQAGVQSMTIRPEKSPAPQIPTINVPQQATPKIVLPDQKAPEPIQASPINYKPPDIGFNPQFNGPELDPAGFKIQRSDDVPKLQDNSANDRSSAAQRDGKLHVTIEHDGVGKVTARGSGNVLGSAPRVTSAMPAFASA